MRCLLLRLIIRERNVGENFVPRLVLDVHVHSEHIGKRLVETFRQAVCLGVVGGISAMRCVAEMQYLLREL